MVNVTEKVIPVITGAAASISTLFRQHQRNLLGKHEIKELKKNSHIGHCTHTSESTNIKVQNILRVRNNITVKGCRRQTVFGSNLWIVGLHGHY
jgi:hypothetical protein